MTPESTLRRSPLYRALRQAGATFERAGDAAAARAFGPGDTPERARRMGLADLSPLPRLGFKGPDLAAWIAERGLAMGAASNRAYRQPGGALLLRLAPGEVILLPAAGPLPEGLDGAGPGGGRLCFPVPRRDGTCWLRVTGTAAPQMFAKLCGVDLRPHRFEPLALAQTSIARLNGLVLRDDLGGVPAYHLLAESASASYLWGCLLDAMDEFQGGPAGLATLEALAAADQGVA